MLIDANIVLRHILGDDRALAAKAESILAPVRNGTQTAIIHHAVIAECVYVLEGQLGGAPAKISRVMSGVLQYPGFVGERLDVVLLAFDYFKTTSLSFVDSLLLAHAEVDRMRIATFDKKLHKLAAKRNLI
jgi:predicted nucleic-acid-binding protein